MYGFACYMDDNRRKVLVLPKKYKQWVKEFNYPVGFVKVRTTNGQVFEVKHINRLFVHHKMDNTIPNYPIVIRGPRKHKVFVRMDVIDNQLYITTGWDRIKKKLSITDEHMLVFEMIDLHTFDMSVFNYSKNADLVLPPELYAAVKEEVVEEVISISDAEDADGVTKGTEANMLAVTTNDETIPVVFRVDNHFRIKKDLAKKIGLDRNRSLKIVDGDGNVWDVRVGIESPDGRFYTKT
ncbi:uncharacterized protein LOC118487142 [Helianthus annuus]|uniref:uncharacterized protein LOC118487142 n=1 Tax=Helianthus annuus TaxID=4232 RepID=UPI001652F4B9|nr:uncharacterized protein LOC118487142 [Helianthus annuus]